MNKVFNAVLMLAAIAGGVWAAFQIYQDYEDRMALIEDRVMKMESVADPETGDRIVRRLASIETRISEVERSIAEVEIETSQATATVDAISGSLVDRISTLEAKISGLKSNGSGGTSAADAQLIAKLEKRIVALEGRPSGSSGSSSGGSIIIPADFEKTFEKKSYDSFEIGLIGCFRKGGTIDCSLVVKNMAAEAKKFYVLAYYNSRGSRAYLPNGEAIFASQVSLGGEADRSRTENLPSEIPVKLNVQFSNVSSSTEGFLIFQLKLGSQEENKVEFRNVGFK